MTLVSRLSSRMHMAMLTALAAGGLALMSACDTSADKNLQPRVSFITLDGSPLGPAQYLGRPLLVNFWASTCSVCIREMPLLQSIHERHADAGLRVVAVAMPYDMPSAAVELQQAKGWRFAVAIDPKGEAVAAFGGVSATPTTVLLDSTGRVAWRHVGELRADTLEHAIEQVLKNAY